ncbi:MAG: DUF1109 domain-containing protein [Sphingomonadales bacterium]|nr:DUF1109 domain-containing protein [Sphingomonadales bacterium]
MRTEDLIAELAASGPAAPALTPRGTGLRMLAAVALAAGLFLMLAGTRADLAARLAEPLILTKTLLPAMLAAIALPLGLRMMRPGARIGRAALWFALPASLAVLLWAATFARTAPAVRFADVTAFALSECVGLIIAIAALPMVFALRLMRAGAATRPRLAGALTGLGIAGLAATGYSLFCTQDNPLFYLTWYGAAIAAVSAAAAALGARWLAF